MTAPLRFYQQIYINNQREREQRKTDFKPLGLLVYYSQRDSISPTARLSATIGNEYQDDDDYSACEYQMKDRQRASDAITVRALMAREKHRSRNQVGVSMDM